MAFPIAAVVALAGAAISFFESRGNRKDAKKLRELILSASSVEELLRIVNELRPVFREIVASGIGPTVQSQIATRTARAGGTKTGIGQAALNIGSAFPEIEAIRQSVVAAQELQANRTAALGGVSPLPSASALDSIVKGAELFVAIKAQQGEETDQTGTPVARGRFGVGGGTPVPAIPFQTTDPILEAIQKAGVGTGPFGGLGRSGGLG